jgi:tetratricopeptide (TPR) repeat protein
MAIPGPWIIEYLLKGLFLGLAYLLVLTGQSSESVGRTAAWTVGAVALVLIVAILPTHSKPKALRGRWLARVVLSVLDRPLAVYVGVISGLVIAAWQNGATVRQLALASLAGTLAGLILLAVVAFTGPVRRWIISVMLLALAAWWWFGPETLGRWAGLEQPGPVRAASVLVLLGLFYLLVFAGRAEETELEVGLLCFGLALALVQLELPPIAARVVVLAPLGLFVFYCERVRRNLAVFKHVIRGLSYEQQDNLREALRSYRWALRTNSGSELAAAGNWRVHRKIDLSSLAADTVMLELIDPLVCLDRARTLLSSNDDSLERLSEVGKLLEIVAYRRTDLPRTIGRERVLLHLAAGRSDDALNLVRDLTCLSAKQTADLADHEAEAQYRTWTIALRDPRLAGCGGLALLDEPHKLFDFLAVIERRLRQIPNDETAAAFKTFVYEKVRLSDYEAYAERHPDDDMDWFDHAHCLRLANGFGPDETARSIQYLRIAEFGLVDQRLSIWLQIAQRLSRQADRSSAEWYRRIKQTALNLGPGKLSQVDRTAFFESVRHLAERARRDGDVEAAIENFELYSESPQAGLATQQTLKELYETRGDPVMAIKSVEAALTYQHDPESRRFWLGEKARLYRQLTAEMVQPLLAKVNRFFDFGHCYREALRLFADNGDSAEVIRYLDLAALGGENFLLQVNYLLGRTYLRTANTSAAVECLEAVRARRPKRFVDADQETAFFTACRILADLWLDELGDPAKAVECLEIYKDYVKSGADTLFKLGRAFEALGNIARARKWYDMVLVYPSHPKAEAARAALARLSAEST